MREERYIAALEIGSSKIIGAVGVLEEGDRMKVIATEHVASLDSVRYGIIQNPEEVAYKVRRVIENLENNPAVAPRKIKGVYVGLSGRSMRSIPEEVKLIFPEETQITEDLLRRLKEDAKNEMRDNHLEIIDIMSRSYHIDGLDTTSPKGAIGKSISATYDIIVSRAELRRNISRALERAGLEIKGFIPTAIACAKVVLTDEEKRLGCMLVDFGAETTSVAIYRKGELWYYATLPLGGRNITRDITSLSVLEEKAEEIKCESGKAIAPENPSTLNLNGVKLCDISNLIVARAEEIVANVIQQIAYADLKDKDLPAGIVCIGGASQLTGILDLIKNMSGINATKRDLPGYISFPYSKAKRFDAVEVSALLYAGALRGDSDCLETPFPDEPNEEPGKDTEGEEVTKTPEPKRKGFLSNISSKLSTFFATPTEDESELD